MKSILALDPANLTGWACSNGTSGTWDLNRHGNRLVALKGFIAAMVAGVGHIDLIAFEESSFGSVNPNTAAMHNELRGIIKLCAAERGIECKGFHPTSIKAFATGSGRAKKPQMIAACKRLLGKVPRDDNEADALFILELAKRPDCWPAEKPKTAKKRGFTKRSQGGLF
jgi:Holliday junction resolvasome RuvABC endonuclease subunit